MTDQQLKTLECCINGANYYDLDQDVATYLLEIGLCEMPLLNPPIVYTSEKGKAVLAAEQKKTEEMAENKAKGEAEKNAEHRFQIKLVFISAAVGSALTLIVDHFGEILEFIRSFFG